jgi:hypothetical protein
MLLSGCDVARNAQNDFARATHAIASAIQSTPAPASTARRSDARAAPKVEDASKQEAPKQEQPRDVVMAVPVSLVGKSESEIHALLGPPDSEEDRAPGKTWHYRDGQCALDVQLYPDVQTRQFGTLAYEVKSNDSTDEGKRLCVAQFKSRTRTNGG